jgi:2-keto-4-pentenoate hydratase/2-oxohepta-3-ene-1,7-dioic acid hydratase in catechol pathway
MQSKAGMLSWKSGIQSLTSLPEQEYSMQVGTYIHEEQQRLGVVKGKNIYDIQRSYLAYCSALHKPALLFRSYSSMLEMLTGGDAALLRAIESTQFVQEKIPLEEQVSRKLVHDLIAVHLQAPISNPGKLIAVGGNYPAAGKLKSPDYPIIFLKPASTITGAGMPIKVSSQTTSVSYEVELAVVIGMSAHRINEADAMNYVAGFCLANDVGDRVLEKRTSQWTTGKMFDTFTPLGQVIFTRDELRYTHHLNMETRVNDIQVQKGNTSSMFFDISQLVSYISHLTTMAPGDIILTGSPKLIDGDTPPAVSLKPGDRVVVAIEGMGELVNPVEAELE